MDFNADVQSLQRGVAERDELLCKLVDQDHVPGLNHVLQSMNKLMEDNLICSTQLIIKVISAVISGSQEEICTRRRLLARALGCVQLQVRRIPADDGELLLQELLARTLNDGDPYAGQILEHLFNDFVRVLGSDCFMRLLDATQSLLLSDEPQDRKSSIVLIRKIQVMCEIGGEHSEALLHLLQCSGQQWTAFAAIIADFEEQDSHLVASTLEEQLPQLQLMASDLGERWLSWLRILFVKLLLGDRVQVLRKTLKYFLANGSVELLCRLTLLPEFLVATNRSLLFDFEDDNCLKVEQLKQFVAIGNLELLLEAMVAVPWENVPLMFWIRSFNSEQVKSVPKELFIKVCLIVRNIDNYEIRREDQDYIIKLFEDTIDGFSLRDYMISMESLFKKGDLFQDFYRLINKIKVCTDFEENIDCFNKRFFDIMFNGTDYTAEFEETLILKMETLPKHKHGFFRFVLFTGNRKVLFMDFYRKFYNVDTSLLQKGASLEKMQEHLLDRLDCQTDEEISFLKARCVDHFTLNLESWQQLEDLNLDALQLLEEGTHLTLNALICLMGAHEKRIRDENVLPVLIARLHNYLYSEKDVSVTKHETKYIPVFKTAASWRTHKRTGTVRHYYFDLISIFSDDFKHSPSIEAACAYNLLCIGDSNALLRYDAINNLRMFGNTEMKSKIFKELLRINEKLSIEHPHYTENSEVHRQKIRIASALIEIRDHCDDPTSLKTLLLPSDDLGIKLMHEFLVGYCVKNIDWVLEALPSLQPRQQESYLSIAYIFIFKNLKKLNKENKLSDMFSQLLPYTMGGCHSTRILAQLFLHKLAVECGKLRILIPLAKVLINSVETSLGNKLQKLKNEPRLWLADILDYLFPPSRIMLYITNVPFDEIGVSFRPDNKYKKARHALKARKSKLSSEVTPPQNPSEGLTLTLIPSEVNNPKKSAGQELILVASLLDKEFEFASLRRTCEQFLAI
ncbi:hypothetical protein KR032_005451 [Drosophila birchii]|nr:hypothetical protein KR032_005451 [Drosophila birchii]